MVTRRRACDRVTVVLLGSDRKPPELIVERIQRVSIVRST